jgi:hypothetical protein
LSKARFKIGWRCQVGVCQKRFWAADEHGTTRKASGVKRRTVFEGPSSQRLISLAQEAQMTIGDSDCQVLIENVRITDLNGAEVLIAPHQTSGCRTTSQDLMGMIDRKLWDNRLQDPQSIEREFRGDKGRGWLMRWLPSRIHDNGLSLIFSNGAGLDDHEIRTGNAMILDPYGRILAETSKANDDSPNRMHHCSNATREGCGSRHAVRNGITP